MTVKDEEISDASEDLHRYQNTATVISGFRQRKESIERAGPLSVVGRCSRHIFETAVLCGSWRQLFSTMWSGSTHVAVFHLRPAWIL